MVELLRYLAVKRAPLLVAPQNPKNNAFSRADQAAKNVSTRYRFKLEAKS
jgi:hypothetical protein